MQPDTIPVSKLLSFIIENEKEDILLKFVEGLVEKCESILYAQDSQLEQKYLNTCMTIKSLESFLGYYYDIFRNILQVDIVLIDLFNKILPEIQSIVGFPYKDYSSKLTEMSPMSTLKFRGSLSKDEYESLRLQLKKVDEVYDYYSREEKRLKALLDHEIKEYRKQSILDPENLSARPDLVKDELLKTQSLLKFWHIMKKESMPYNYALEIMNALSQIDIRINQLLKLNKRLSNQEYEIIKAIDARDIPQEILPL